MSDLRDRWEYYGANDPYFAVFSIDKFKVASLDGSGKEEFFLTGKTYIDQIWGDIMQNFDANFHPENALDFGCGVGRIAIPLASKVEHLVGVDISETMLSEARQNCETRKITNVDLMQSAEFLASDNLRFDLVHSVIVFQHIEPKNGLTILEKILDRLNDNGIGVLHFTYAGSESDKTSLMFRLYRDHEWIYKARNTVLRRDEPLIPMYRYDLNAIFKMLHHHGIHRYLVRATDHGLLGALIFFQKKPDRLY
jgi:SAM-dependent methyltransferase